LSEGGKITVDGPFLGLHGLGIWSKDRLRARDRLTLDTGGTRGKRALFLCRFSTFNET